MSDEQKQRAEKIFPCNCKQFKDGSHYHWCQAQYADWVIEDFEKDAQRIAALEAENAELREGINRAAMTILMADANGTLTGKVVKDAFEWLQKEASTSGIIKELESENAELKRQLAEAQKELQRYKESDDAYIELAKNGV